MLVGWGDKLPFVKRGASVTLRERERVAYAPVLGALQRALDPKLIGLVPEVRALPSTCTDMYLLIEAPAHAVSAIARDQHRPYATPGRPRDHELTGFHRRARHGGVVSNAN